MAEAFRSGNLGIMDYYKMKNIEADTSMLFPFLKALPNQERQVKETSKKYI